jgi:muconolactone delta-isomerase
MDFLVEFDICIPPDYDPAKAADLQKRERKRAAEIVSQGNFFKKVWVVPGRRARIAICSAPDAQVLDETFASLPAAKWNKMSVTPLFECPTDTSICIFE